MAKVLFLIKLYRIISTYELAVWLGFMVICYFITGVLISSKTFRSGSSPDTPAKIIPIFFLLNKRKIVFSLFLLEVSITLEVIKLNIYKYSVGENCFELIIIFKNIYINDVF